MSRTTIPFATADISALAKSLRAQLANRDGPPGHVEMLNILARAAGRRNFQQLRAESEGRPAAEISQTTPTSAVDAVQIARVAGHFDALGRMVRWPSRTRHQELCLWVLWSRLPARRAFTEAEVNALIKAQHLFGDHAILRRSLCNSRLLSRTRDGAEYRRVEREPPPEAAALIRQVLATRAPPG
ncbi:MAG: DUF2087 domain-containing protein [Pseudomonadota bacterium]